MRAIIVATDLRAEIAAISDVMPSCMLPLVDKPFVQHLAEYLIFKGVTEIEFVLARFPEKIENLLGDGTRLGVPYTFHLTLDPDRSGRTIRHLCRAAEGPVLLVDADTLIAAPGLLDETPGPTLWMRPNEVNASGWTGWAYCDSSMLRSIPDTASRETVFQCLRSAGAECSDADHVLDATSFDSLLLAQKDAMAGKIPELVISGNRRGNGIIIGRSARVHRSAQLVGPLYIGEFSQIGKEAKLGPGTIVGRDCVIDSGCRTGDSLILNGTYLSGELVVFCCIADRNLLYSERLGAEIATPDDLGHLADKGGLRTSRTMSRVAAWMLLIFFSPLMLLVILARGCVARGRVLDTKRMVSLPASRNPRTWTYFDRFSFGDASGRGRIAQWLMSDLPGLLNVAAGDMFLVGVPARTAEEVQALEPEWRDLYLGSKVGLITEARVRSGESPGRDSQHASDSFYVVNRSQLYDLKLIGAFICSQMLPPIFRRD